ncbi:MAG: hypothetical protein GY732_05010, partial [Gammaproteobacteria bacterium]|nr:hypothetical protein [Gammaproteobacteria bacterium]
MTNSTFSGNSAVDAYNYGSGGGIFAYSNLSVTHCTFVNNTNDGISNGYASAIFASGATVTSLNNLFAGHASPTTTGASHTNSYDHGATVPAWLGSLANNGGSTHTHALAAGGTSAIDQASGSQTRDQRGYVRDSSPDIGAYEYNGSPPSTPTNTPTPVPPTPTNTPTPVPPTPTNTPTPVPPTPTNTPTPVPPTPTNTPTPVPPTPTNTPTPVPPTPTNTP